MLTITNAFSRTSEKENQWAAKHSRKKMSVKNESSLSLGPPDLNNEERRGPSSAVSSSSLNYRRASEATPDSRKSSQRPISSGATVKRNSSNRSTASEGSKRKPRKRTLLSPEEDESSNGQQQNSSSPIVGTAASLLRLMLPFAWERMNSKNVSPSREILEQSDNRASIKTEQVPPPIPYPQRAPPPVPNYNRFAFGDHISISSGNSSLAGHIYEQVSFSPERSNSLLEESQNIKSSIIPSLPVIDPEFQNQDFEVCIPGEIRAVKRSSRKRKKSRSKGTFTGEWTADKKQSGRLMSSAKSYDLEKEETVLSFSLPQKHSPANNHFCHVGYVNKSSAVHSSSVPSSSTLLKQLPHTSTSRRRCSATINSSSSGIDLFNKNSKGCENSSKDSDEVCSYFWCSSRKMDVAVEMTGRSLSDGECDKLEDDEYLRPPPPPNSSPDRRGTLTRNILFTPSLNDPEGKFGCERWRVEGEICRVQEALSERLGSPPVMLRRRDQRLHAINSIEKAIQRLRQDSISSHQGIGDAEYIPSSTDKRKVNSSSDQQINKRDSYQEIMDVVNANQTREPVSNGHTSSMDEAQLHSHHPDLGEPPAHNGIDDETRIHPTVEAVLKGNWPFEKASLWHSSPASMGVSGPNGSQETTPGIMSTSSVTSRRAQSQQQLLTNKVEMVYGLLSMFSSGDRDNMSRTLLAMSSSPDSCVSMRQSGCLPLLIQLLHGGDDNPPSREARLRAAQAIHNIVYSHPDDKRGRREARVLRLLEQLRDYSDCLWEKLERLCAGRGPLLEDSMDQHPGPAMAALMKLSFDEEHRHAMCALGGLHAIAELIKRDHEAHGSTTADQHCTTLRRYAGMALTNLTFGDGTNKALLSSFKGFMCALVSQLHSPSEDLRQVTASVLRNLSWRADGGSKSCLREVGAVTALTEAALTAKKESTLKVILSAVWNLSAHCSNNKADICAVEGALAFICSTLTYKSQSKTLSIIENGGGILRNISSHIALRDDLRQVLRDHNAMTTLLAQLLSPSLTVVSNACGTLWNLSARCPQDQMTLWKEGAVPMLRSLINSKHKMISMGSSAALKNLLQARPEGMPLTDGKHGLGLPTLQARKQKALEQELDQSLAETCDNIESSPRSSPTGMLHSLGPHLDAMRLSDSRDSIASTDSSPHDRMQQLLLRHHRAEAESSDSQHFNIFNKFVSQNKAIDGVGGKMQNLGNKYCNGSKPAAQINNYIDNSREFDEEQPTNFSLRYTSEGESQGEHRRKSSAKSDNACPKSNGCFETDLQEDSLKTFYTEGTPYNFSTATSLGDLRDHALSEIEQNSTSRRPAKGPQLEPNDEDIDLELEDFNDSELEILNKETHPSSKVHKPGAVDNPVTFCVEGTPVSLSRISSVSSISSDDIEQRIAEELLEDDDEGTVNENQQLLKEKEKTSSESPACHGEARHLTVCNETPLMFSRTTSVSSLSSFEIQSIHDDRSSVVSDFSRMTSGIISPSDLPDSPSQTVPTSPKRGRNASGNNFSSANPVSVPNSSVFGDIPRSYMDEGTPAGFSHGTSLSSLTFEDEDIPPRSRGDGKDSSTGTSASDMSQPFLRTSRDPVRSSIPRPQSSGHENTGGFVSRTSSEGPPLRFSSNCARRTPSEGPPQRTSSKRETLPDGKLDSDAEEKLAAVIQSGMPSGSYRLSAKSPSGAPNATTRMTGSNRQALSPAAAPPPPPPMPPMAGLGLGSAIPIKTANLQVTVQAIDFSSTNAAGNWSGSDSLHDFCTEGTPANGSNCGSVSNLSELSIPGTKSPRSSNESVESYEGKKKLERCIQLGLPKPRPTQRSKERTAQDRNMVLSPRRSPQQRPLPVARVSPALKVGVVSPQPKNSLFGSDDVRTYGIDDNSRGKFSPATSTLDLTKPTVGGKRPGLRPPRPIIGQSISPLSDNGETPERFQMEDTPANLSRHSSMSSIGGLDEKTNNHELVRRFETENTPTTFSHNSSLSSISVESEGNAHREEALLRTCISQGMPKGTTSRIPAPPSRAPRQSPSISVQSDQRCSFTHEAESKKLHSENEESEKELLTHSLNQPTNSSIQSSQQTKRSSPEEGRPLDYSDPSWGSEEGRLDSSSLSESNAAVVLAEAFKVAKAVSKNQNSSDDMSLMTASASSVCLDMINPPSAMGSLLSLSSASMDDGKTFVRPPKKMIECRHTKKMPEMVRRALGDQEFGGDGGSLASSCHSNLDNIFPPFLVGDDMESSMISVASITSEVCETKDSSPNGASISTEVLEEIEGPARQIASFLLKEAQQSSTVTLVAAEETSTCQEITDLEETIAVTQQDDVASDTELAADDLPVDIPDLPQDSPLRSGTPASSKSSPKFSPRRRLSQDRFRTFTRDRSSSGSGIGTPDSSRSPAKQKTPKQRRSEDADRYKTRTISCDSLPPSQIEQQKQSLDLPIEQTKGKIVPVHNESRRSSFKQRRQENPSRFQTRTIDVPINDFSRDIVEFNDDQEEDLSLTQAQMEALSQDANIVICSLNETRESMTTSETGGDIFTEENILDIETLSLISNEDEEELMMQYLSSDCATGEIKKPRIVKPGEKTLRPSNQETPPIEKTIRGRRRPLYSSGRNQAHAPCSISKAVPPPPIRPSPLRGATSKPPVLAIQPRPTRASTLRQNKSDEASKQNSSPGSSAGSSPKLGSSSSRSSSKGSKSNPSKDGPYPLKRQNTFTKEEETSSPVETQSTKKVSAQQTKSSSRSKVRKDMVQPMSSTRACSQEWSPPRGAKTKSSSLTRDALPPSSKDMAEWGGTPSNKKGKKDVTSRIASLWKRVEKAQGKKSTKDDRVWIGGNQAPLMRPLVRSSTFEKEVRTQRSGLGLKLSRLRGRDTHSSPPSEASTPVESRPHSLISPTRVVTRQRPATHPSVTPRTGTQNTDKEKRLSRLGSFFVVDDEDQETMDAISRASSMTRIPKPLQNDSRDSNGNSTPLFN